MALNVQAARDLGYSDQEILDYLQSTRGINIDAAREIGYDEASILSYLSERDDFAPPALAEPATPALDVAPVEEPDTTFFGQVGETLKAVPRGFANSFLSAGEGVAELADAATNALGFEDAIDSGDQNALVAASREGRRLVQEYLGADEAYRDEWFTKFGEGVGSFASFFTPAAVVKAAGLAGKAAKIGKGALGGTIAGGGYSGEMAQRVQAAREAGIEVSEDQEDLAVVLSFVGGLSELFPVERLLRGLPKTVDDVFKQGIMERLKSAAVSGGVEGLQEVGGAIYQDMVERGVFNEDLPATDSLWEDFTIGGSIGALADLALNSAAGRVRTQTTQAQRDYEQSLRDQALQAIAEQEAAVSRAQAQDAANRLPPGAAQMLAALEQQERERDSEVDPAQIAPPSPRQVTPRITTPGRYVTVRIPEVDPETGDRTFKAFQAEERTRIAGNRVISFVEEPQPDGTFKEVILSVSYVPEGFDIDPATGQQVPKQRVTQASRDVEVIESAEAPESIQRTQRANPMQRYAQHVARVLGARFPVGTKFEVKQNDQGGFGELVNGVPKFSVVDSRGRQYGIQLDTLEDAAIFAGSLNEQIINTEVMNGIDQILDTATQTYTPEQANILRLYGFRALHPDQNTYTSAVIDLAAGTTQAEGFDQLAPASTLLQQGVKPSQLTASQRINAKRLEKGLPEVNTFTVEEALSVLGENFGNLADPSITGEVETETYSPFRTDDGKFVVVSSAGEVLDGRPPTLRERDQSLKSRRRPPKKIPFANKAEAQAYAARLNENRGINQINFFPEGSLNSIKRLLSTKNIDNTMNDPEFKQLAELLTGVKIGNRRISDLRPGEIKVLYQKLRSLPRFNVPTKLPSFKLKSYTRNQFQIANNLVRSGVVDPEAIGRSVGIDTATPEGQRKVNDLLGDLRSQGAMEQAQEVEKVAEEGPILALPGPPERETALLKALQKSMDRTGLRDVALHLDYALQNVLRNADGELVFGVRARRPDDPATAREFGTEGRFVRADVDERVGGFYSGALNRIALATDRMPANATREQQEEFLLGILNHEQLHAMRNLDLFTQKEWSVLTQLARTKRNKDGETYLERANKDYGDMGEAVQIEEAIAELTRDARKDRRLVSGKPRKVMERITDFMIRLKNFLNGAGFQSFEDVIDRIEKGEIGSRGRGEIRTLYRTDLRVDRLPGLIQQARQQRDALARQPGAETQLAEANQRLADLVAEYEGVIARGRPTRGGPQVAARGDTAPPPPRGTAREEDFPEELLDEREARTKAGKPDTRVRPEVAAAYEKFVKGEITRKQYDAVVLGTISPYAEIPEPATYEEMYNALDSKKKPNINVPIKDGAPVGLRLDIPAYNDHGVWVPTIHFKGPKGESAATSHRATALIQNADFSRASQKTSENIMEGSVPGTPGYENRQEIAQRIVGPIEEIRQSDMTDEEKRKAIDKLKSPLAKYNKTSYAQILGNFVNRSDAENAALAEEALNDPAWTQVGFDPRRHSYFYDRATGEPVTAAEEVVQVGPLVLAKNALKNVLPSGEAFETRYAMRPQGEEDVRSQRGRDRAGRDQVRGPAAAADQGAGRAPLPGAPIREGATGPDPGLNAAAEAYADSVGIPLTRQTEYVKVDPAFAGRIAQAFEEMEDAPTDPRVQKAYRDLVRQTKAQYDALVDAGYTFTFYDGETDPYDGNPYNAMRDLRNNKRMAVYGTYDGYGTPDDFYADLSDPNRVMLQDSGLRWKDQNGEEKVVTNNDLFRAVHDAFGHGLEGAGFRGRGEENAWQAHAKLFTGPALEALTTETRGQNSWLNYGPYGEQNRNAGVLETVFADQKMGLMPSWTSQERRDGIEDRFALLPREGDARRMGITNEGLMPSAEEIQQMRDGTFKPPVNRTKIEAAQFLYEYWMRATGRTAPFEYNEDTLNLLADAIFEEGLAAFENDSNAIGWYDAKIKAAKAVMRLIDPRITETAENEAAFDYVLAVTSNGQAVVDNFKHAARLFDQYMKTGKLPTTKRQFSQGGDRNAAMLTAFRFFNEYNKSGANMPLRDFLDQDFTVKELRKFIDDFNKKAKKTVISVPEAESVNTIVKGSYILGPKIGQGFYQNIRGNYETLTMDLWWMRMWNRLIGRPFKARQDLTKSRNELRELISKVSGNPRMLINEVLEGHPQSLEEILQDEDLTEQFIVDLERRYQRYYKERKEATGKPPAKPPIFKKTGTYVKNMKDDLQAAPKSATEREFMRRVAQEAQRRLSKRNINITMADLQALLWYPEKQLFRALGVRPGRGADNDYLDAAIMLAEEKGVSRGKIEEALRNADRDRAVDSRAGARRQDGAVRPDAQRDDGAQEIREARLPAEEGLAQLRYREPARVERTVKENEEAAIQRGDGFPRYSYRADPEAQYVAQNPDDAAVVSDQLMDRYARTNTPELSDAEQEVIGRNVAPPPEGVTPGQTYMNVTGEGKISYLLTKFKQGAINRFARLEKLNQDPRLKNHLAETSSIAAALFADKAKSILAAALKYGPPVYRNGGTKAETFTHNGKEYRGLIDVMAPLYDNQYGKSLEEIAQAYAIAVRSERLKARGLPSPSKPGDLQAIEQIVNRYVNPETGQPIIKEWLSAWQAYNSKTVEFLKATGILDEQTADVWANASDYIPFYRQAEGEELGGVPGVFSGLTSAGEFDRIKGSERAVNIPMLEAITRNLSTAIEMGMKNVAQQRIVRDMITLGMARQIPMSQPSGNYMTVTLKVKGKKRKFIIDDPLIYESMQPLADGEMTQMLNRFLGAPARLLRETVTRDPGFMTATMMRDTLSAWVTSGSSFVPVIDTVRGLADGMETLEKYGVVGGYDINNDPDDVVKFFNKQAAKRGHKLAGQAEDSIVFKPFIKLWDALGEATNRADAATRKAVYDDVLARTGSEQEAALQALEIMNHGRRGSSALARVLTSAIPFLNARFQGLDVLYRAYTGQYSANSELNRRQKVQSAITRSTLLMGLTGLYYMLVSDDEEYRNQNDEVRDNNFIIPTGTGVPVKIPIPFEVGILFKTIPERVLDASVGETSSREMRDSIQRAVVSTFEINPLGIQAIAPIVEAAMNHNFYTGRQIVPYYMDQGAYAELQERSSSSQIAQFIGKEMAISPLKVDHIMYGYMGTLGGYALDAVDTILRSPALTGEKEAVLPARRLYEYPVLKRFFGSEYASGAKEDFYEVNREITRLVGSLNKLKKRGDVEQYEAYLQSRGHLLGLRDSTNYIANELSKLRDQRTMIERSDMSAEQKRDLIDSIEEATAALLGPVPKLKRYADLPAFEGRFAERLTGQ